jgi:endonuclease YncB( thermonuclease family)
MGCCYSIDIKNISDDEIKSIPNFSLHGIQTNCKVERLIDGDTFVGCIVLDGKVRKFRFRLNGLDCYEIHSKEQHKKLLADKGLEFSSTFIFKNKNVVFIECFKFDKYGRVLCNVYSDKSKSKLLNSQLIEKGFAVVYDGGKKTI